MILLKNIFISRRELPIIYSDTLIAGQGGRHVPVPWMWAGEEGTWCYPDCGPEKQARHESQT